MNQSFRYVGRSIKDAEAEKFIILLEKELEEYGNELEELKTWVRILRARRDSYKKAKTQILLIMTREEIARAWKLIKDVKHKIKCRVSLKKKATLQRDYHDSMYSLMGKQKV